MAKSRIPNALTIVRLIFVPFVIFFMLYPSTWIHTQGIRVFNNILFWNDWVAFFLFIIAAVTDFIDGYLARKWKVESDWGRLWDPIADKALVNSTLIAMCITNNLPVIIVIALIVRDICVDALRMTNAKGGIVLAAGKQGKLKTVFQMLAIVVLFMMYPTLDPVKVEQGLTGFLAYDYAFYVNSFGIILLIVATVFSFSSMGVYFVGSRKALKAKAAKEADQRALEIEKATIAESKAKKTKPIEKDNPTQI